jgi:NADPH2:quinone reductase
MLPYVPGNDFVGTIQIVGEDANAEGSLRIGDRVAGVSTCGGGNSRFISIPANRLTKISTNVKSTHAVCLVHDYMAALKTLRLARKGGSMFTGLNILITDGFSPVGQAIIALASMEGAKLYCCADETKHPYLASLGVKCFDVDPEVWLPGVANTFDIVIDNSCFDGYSSSWRALNKKGTLICLGPLYNVDLDIQSPPSACGALELTEMHQKWSELKAKYMMSKTYFLNTETTFEDDTEQYRKDLSYLMFLCARGDIIPKVAERVSLDDVKDAQRLLQIGKANGTVVCVPWIQE